MVRVPILVTSFLVRRATLDDLDAIVDLRMRFLQDVGRVEDEHALRASVGAYLRRALPTEQCVIWVAETDEEVVGTGAMTIYERMSWDGVSPEGYVLNMFTDPARRKAGIASAIVEGMLGYARDREMRLCLISMDDARGIYERAGFRPDERYLRWRSS